MVNIYIDTREPASIKYTARTLGFIPMALESGDYSTDKLIVERKEIGDFVNSIFARYGETSRMSVQAERLFTVCQESERIPLLLICGKLCDVEKQFSERKQTLNRNAIYGALASLWVRYAFNIIWTEQPAEEWLAEIKMIAEKIDEGKWMMPQRKKLKEFSSDRNIAVVERALDLNHQKAVALVKKYGGLYNVLHAAKTNPSEIYLMENFGARTLQKIKELGGIS